MSLSNPIGRTGRTLAFSAAILAAVGLSATPKPAHALGPAEGVAIGLGALALGTAVGAAANPYYYGYPGPYYGSAYYYPPAPAYYGYPGPANRCWNPYYGRFYPC